MERIAPISQDFLEDKNVSKKYNTYMVKYSTGSKRSEQRQHMSTWVDDPNEKLEGN